MTRIGRPSLSRDLGISTWQRLLAGVLLGVTFLSGAISAASAETRTLKLYYVHTKERAEITYKKNGKYIQSGLSQLNRFLRDWRRDEPTKMDPRLFDIVWEVYRATGARDYVHVVSAYRSPATNAMLRKRSRGVATKSQHMLGKAMDFYIPGVKLAELRKAGLRVQGGGVGYYPSSGSPFVHLDVGSVRHWPRMSRGELAAVFPNGKTLHVPTDGKPLPGYEMALADYNKRKGAGVAIASAEPSKRSGGFLANLFGGGADEEEDNNDTAAPSVAVAAAPAARLPGVVDAPFPPATVAPAPAEKVTESPAQIIAALPLREVPRPMFAPRPTQDVGAVIAAAAPAGAPPAELPATAVVAENVPIPMPRPNLDTGVVSTVAAAPVSPADSSAGLAIETILARESGRVPGPKARPGDPVEMTALVPMPAPDRRAAVAAKGERVAMLGNRPVSPREALRGAPGEPVAVVMRGQITTPKAPKPSPSDARPEPRSIQLPVNAGVASRVIGEPLEGRVAQRPNGHAFAFNSIRSAPTEVYTAGFRAEAAPDPQRFTGKAVTFMSVAKFRPN